jgi:hypothetical protein
MLMKEPPPPPLDPHAAYPRPVLGASAFDEFLVFTEDPVPSASVNTEMEEAGGAGGTERETAASVVKTLREAAMRSGRVQDESGTTARSGCQGSCRPSVL